MRISFDMDGVLADMDSALARLAEVEFGVSADVASRPSQDALRQAGQAPEAAKAETSPYPSSAILERLSARQQARLWQRVGETRNFWETLAEHEPGTVRRLQDLAYQLRWEVLFVTQRPATAGRTTQVQTQRWLHKNGFDLPAVYTTRGSRGQIAAALTLDAHIDDRLDNAVDIATDSRAWSILVWRDEVSFERVQMNGRKFNIAVVRSVNEALDKIATADKAGPSAARGTGRDTSPADDAAHTGPALIDRLKRTFGFTR
jgi:phosphoglycolate phosphatase-like HAD superfamily hydrolase